MIHGCFSVNGIGTLHVIKGNMNRKTLQATLIASAKKEKKADRLIGKQIQKYNQNN